MTRLAGVVAAFLLGAGVAGAGVYLAFSRSTPMEPAHSGQPLEEIARLWESGDLERAAQRAMEIGEDSREAPVADAWLDRIRKRQAREQEDRLEYRRIAQRIAAIPETLPPETLRDVYEELEDRILALDEPSRVKLTERWQKKEAAVRGYWRANAGGLAVDSLPGGAEVMIGGERVETTPLRLGSLPAGDYTLRISRPGYEPWRETVTVTAGEFTDRGTVELEHSTGDLQVDSHPEGLDFRLVQGDDENGGIDHRGRTPARFDELHTGAYRVEFSLPRWPEDVVHERTVRVMRNEEARVRFETGTLVLLVDGPRSGEWELRVDDNTVRPERNNEFRLPAGEEYRVRVDAPGWEAREGTVRLEPADERVVRLDLPRSDWTPIFRSRYPAHWNTRIPKTPTAFAIPVAEAPEDMEYLRLRRMDAGTYVIIPLTHSELRERVEIDESIVWNGTARFERRHPTAGIRENYLLGIANRRWEAPYRQGGHFIVPREGSRRSGYRGWGFSKQAYLNSNQTWSWHGSRIDPVVFEIAVKPGPLRAEERRYLLAERTLSQGN